MSVAGCAKKYSAERDGKKLGEAVCDLRTRTPKEDAQSALDEIENQLGDMSTKYTLFTAEDRADIDENLSDLREHVAAGQEDLAQQDLRSSSAAPPTWPRTPTRPRAPSGTVSAKGSQTARSSGHRPISNV